MTACPTCGRPADVLLPTICRDDDGAFRADVCAECHESFALERQVMGQLAQHAARSAGKVEA